MTDLLFCLRLHAWNGADVALHKALARRVVRVDELHALAPGCGLIEPRVDLAHGLGAVEGSPPNRQPDWAQGKRADQGDTYRMSGLALFGLATTPAESIKIIGLRRCHFSLDI